MMATINNHHQQRDNFGQLNTNSTMEKVILGEATTLSTFILKNNQRLTKANYIQLSRMTSMIIEYEIEHNNNDNENNDNDEEWLQMVDPLLKNLILLRCRLLNNKQKNLDQTLDASYFKPFCDVIVNKDVSGPVTGLALQSIQKFLTYGFIKDNDIVRLISESVTKARFVGTDSNSDEAVLMTILSVLESLIVGPFYSLTNGIICEIMQSCFRIAFEMRLSELLRKCAVKSLTEMVRALFTRISLFNDRINNNNCDDDNVANTNNNNDNNNNTNGYNYFYHDKNNASFHKLNRMGKRFVNNNNNNNGSDGKKQNIIKRRSKEDLDSTTTTYIQQSYGLACIHELLSYLTSLINPLPDGQNTDYMINVGLQLLTIIFEISVGDIGANYCLLSVVKTDLCWNIQQLLQNEKNLNTFTNVLRLSFLIYGDLRMHLKYQFQTYLLRLMDIIATVNIPLEYRDLCIEYLLQFFHHIPYLSHELYFNYDCDPYATNIMEDLLQLLLKNCFSLSTNNNDTHPNSIPSSPTSSLSPSLNLNFNTLQILSFQVLLSNLKSLQMAELLKNNKDDVYLIANPATMIVQISNIRDLNTVVVPQINNNNNDNDKNSSTTTTTTTIEQFNNVIIDMNLNNYCEDDSSVITSPNMMTDAIGGDNKNNENSIEQSTGNSYENFEHINHNDNDTIKNESTIDKQQIIPETTTTTTINKYCITYLFPQQMTNIPINNEQIEALKQRKSLLWQATDKFNQKPSKGVEFLYENKLVYNDDDVVAFLRDNSRLDKKALGEYLSNKKNMTVLSKFVQSFTFKDIRIDEALRLYLESFRLPGEAPLISLVLEQFAHHWHESNGCPFVNEDAAFSLAYAIIMLNVDQHNSNVKRQTNPMTCEEFISNLRQVNGGKDFDRNMLTEIYHVIKNNEIIMPAEQQGVIREKYLWKCLLKNSETLNGIYWFNLHQHSYNNSNHYFKNIKKDFNVKLLILNRSIFEISCSPTISTLTLIFDRLNPNRQQQMSKLILNEGFSCCSLLCAQYGHLDNLIENLSKFVIVPQSSSTTTTTRLTTTKSELVACCLFNICKEYSNEMRQSWKNIIELILYWYDNKLLDNGLQIDDFALESKKLSFVRRTTPKINNLNKPNEQNQSTFFLSSFYSYFSSNTEQELNNDDTNANEQQTNDKLEQQQPQQQNDYCRTLQLIIDESKFLHIDSLIELIKAIIQIEYYNYNDDDQQFDDDIEIFKLEILLKIIFLNRDRLSIFWDLIYRHIIRLMKFSQQSELLTERLISAVFRLAIRFTSRPNQLNDQIFLLLYHILLDFHPEQIQRNTTAQTIHSFISSCNCYLTKTEQWSLLFNMILAVSIGYYPLNKTINNQQQLDENKKSSNDLVKLSSTYLNVKKNLSDNIFTMNNQYQYRIMDAEAYEKCMDIMVLIIKDYLPNNAKIMSSKNDNDTTTIINVYEISQMAVGVLCRFVEASIKIQFATAATTNINTRQQNTKIVNKSRLSRLTNAILSSSESDSDDEYHQQRQHQHQQQFLNNSEITTIAENVALKLLDLIHYFLLYAPSIAGDQLSSDILWNTIWCPLLQAFAFFCCDCRRPIRTYSFTFLQRTLLLHNLQVLNANQWESCFNKVLFPLLSKLLEPINMCDPIGMDETRMRTTNLLCKVFLQHLNPLLTLNTFTALWLTILDFMEKYIKADMQTELVKEAIPESLKNILLVMKTAGCFNDRLASITWDRINRFLPNLYRDMIETQIKQQSEQQQQQQQQSQQQQPQQFHQQQQQPQRFQQKPQQQEQQQQQSQQQEPEQQHYQLPQQLHQQQQQQLPQQLQQFQQHHLQQHQQYQDQQQQPQQQEQEQQHLQHMQHEDQHHQFHHHQQQHQQLHHQQHQDQPQPQHQQPQQQQQPNYFFL